MRKTVPFVCCSLLAGEPKKQEAAGGNTEELVETFELPTAIRGSVNRDVEPRSVGSGLALGDAIGHLSTDRTDKRSLVIALAPNYDAAKLSLCNQNVYSKPRKIEGSVRRSSVQ